MRVDAGFGRNAYIRFEFAADVAIEDKYVKTLYGFTIIRK